MGKKDARVDAYIRKSVEFAKPILKHLRQLVHTACPDAEEALKWGFPHFLHDGILCGMAAFKRHCALHIWKGRLIFKDGTGAEGAMGQFGRITALSDLPADRVLIGYLKQVARLNEDGVKPPPRPGSTKKKLVVPVDFTAALKKNKKALAAFEGFSTAIKRNTWNGSPKPNGRKPARRG